MSTLQLIRPAGRTVRQVPIDLAKTREFAYPQRLRQLLWVLVITLTFEGVVRKAAPGGLSTAVFFMKDFIVLALGYYVWQTPSVPAIAFLGSAYRVMMVLFVPPVLVTAWYDPVLAVFGIKQYLLYPIVGLAVFYAFQDMKKEVLLRFLQGVALLIIPTALMALLQIRLPHDHWLNLAVNGDDLESFSSNGHLRVSSTFSFVAQYAAFLNMETFVIIIALVSSTSQNLARKFLAYVMVGALVMSAFITGSRGAVDGTTAIVLIACVLVSMKFQVRNLIFVAVLTLVLVLLVYGVNAYFPEITAVYFERENGQLLGFSDEIQQRVFSSFKLWSSGNIIADFFGWGLGVMSNGSDSLSSYAGYWRGRFWTETDFATTFFEGGYYLVVVWYGFRAYVMFETTRRYLSGITAEFSVSGAFAQAFVLIIGTIGTLALQPPIAIWWWFGVGVSLLFWWKSVGPDEEHQKDEKPTLPVARKPPRGRSLYADALHNRK